MQRGDRDGLATGFGNDDMRRSTPRERPGWPVVVAGTIAVAVVLGPPLLLLRYREARMAKVSTPEARAVWDAFRAEMSRQSGDTGPVKHKVPKSAEPPELVWLRDYTPLAAAIRLPQAPVRVGTPLSAAENCPARDGHDEEQNQGNRQDADKRKHARYPLCWKVMRRSARPGKW